MTIVMDIREMYFRYRHVEALRGISFQVRRGEIFGLLGPNGAGKTTLIDILTAQRVPLRGEAKMLGLDCQRDAQKLRKEIGLASHDFRVNGHLKVKEVLTFYGILYGLPRSSLHERVRELIEAVGLEAKQETLVSALSEGLKRRLNLALAVIHDPPVLILDEPTDALDPRAKRRLWTVLDRLRARGKTILLTTHDMDEAELLCDRVAIIDQGRIVAVDTVAGLKSLLGETKVVEIRMECEPEIVDEYRTAIQETNIECLRGLVIFTANPQVAIQRVLEYRDLVDQASMVVRNPSLEDVFMKLTGRAFQTPEHEEHEPEAIREHRIRGRLIAISRILRLSARRRHLEAPSQPR